MKKRRVKRATKSTVPEKEQPRSSDPSRLDPHVGVKIVAIALRHLEYAELPSAAGAVPPDTSAQLDVSLNVQGTINLYEPDLGEFVLDVTALPDPGKRPISVKAKVSVLLRRDAAMPAHHLGPWIQQFGVFIVFPYVREVISNVTSRGIFGPMFLDPIAVDSLTTRAQATRDQGSGAAR